MIVASREAASMSSRKLAEQLGVEVVLFKERIFPDGEIKICAQSPKLLSGEDEVILFFDLYPEPNSRLVGLFQSLDIVRDYSPESHVTLIIPYLIYARQDKRFLEGEAISLKTLLSIVEGFGVERLISVDTHNPDAMREYTRIQFDNIAAATAIALHAKEKVFGGRDFIIISPDLGGVERVRRAAEVLDLQHSYLRKERNRHTGEVSVSPTTTIPMYGRGVFLLDDIISTGGTLVKAANALKNMGVEELAAGATHLLLLDRADKRLFEAGYTRIIGSNTVETPYSEVSVEGLIAEEIRKS